MQIFISIENNKVKDYQIGSGFPGSILVPEEYSLNDLEFLSIETKIEQIEFINKDIEGNEFTDTKEEISYEFSLNEQIKNEIIEQRQQELALNNLRNIRNSLLQETDFTQLIDAPLSDEQKELYRIYREQLRNLPETVEDVLNPVYPLKP